MRVKLVKESSGFGYSYKISSWLAQSDENMGLLKKLQKGAVVELPEKVAMSIHNLVDIETGKMISRRYQLSITEDEVKHRYLDTSLEEVANTRKIIKDLVKVEDTTKIEVSSTIKPIEEEETD